jgi:hypothetical protein
LRRLCDNLKENATTSCLLYGTRGEDTGNIQRGSESRLYPNEPCHETGSAYCLLWTSGVVDWVPCRFLEGNGLSRKLSGRTSTTNGCNAAGAAASRPSDVLWNCRMVGIAVLEWGTRSPSGSDPRYDSAEYPFDRTGRLCIVLAEIPCIVLTLACTLMMEKDYL